MWCTMITVHMTHRNPSTPIILPAWPEELPVDALSKRLHARRRAAVARHVATTSAAYHSPSDTSNGVRCQCTLIAPYSHCSTRLMWTSQASPAMMASQRRRPAKCVAS